MVIAILTGTLLIVGLVLWILDRRKPYTESSGPELHDDESPQECCGMHITCEKDSLLAGVSDTVEYYEDQELDRFAGRSPESYTDQETEEFRDVLLTLKPEEIAGWGRSIQLRQIALPEAVRDELLMIVAEARRAIQ